MVQSQTEILSESNLNPINTKTKNTYPTSASVFKLFFVLLFYTICFALLAGAVRSFLNSQHINSPKVKSLLNLLMYIGILSFTIRYTRRKSKRTGYPVKINFNKIQWWLIPVVVTGTLALIVPLSQSTAWIPIPKWFQKVFDEIFTKDIFSILTVCVAAPLFEEVLCRGIILKGLLRNYTPLKAILISAVFFALIHLNPWQAIPAFFGGLFLGWVYFKTQSVIPGIIIHATINCSAMLLSFYANRWSFSPNSMGMAYYLTTLFVSILVFSTVCIIIDKKAVAMEEPVFRSRNSI